MIDARARARNSYLFTIPPAPSFVIQRHSARNNGAADSGPEKSATSGPCHTENQLVIEWRVEKGKSERVILSIITADREIN